MSRYVIVYEQEGATVEGSSRILRSEAIRDALQILERSRVSATVSIQRSASPSDGGNSVVVEQFTRTIVDPSFAGIEDEMQALYDEAKETLETKAAIDLDRANDLVSEIRDCLSRASGKYTALTTPMFRFLQRQTTDLEDKIADVRGFGTDVINRPGGFAHEIRSSAAP